MQEIALYAKYVTYFKDNTSNQKNLLYFDHCFIYSFLETILIRKGV